MSIPIVRRLVKDLMEIELVAAVMAVYLPFSTEMILFAGTTDCDFFDYFKEG